MTEPAPAIDPEALKAQAVDHLARSLGQMLGHLQHTPADRLIDEATELARRNPALVLGGAALLGFAAARAIKGATS